MNKFFLFLVLLSAAFGGSFAWARLQERGKGASLESKRFLDHSFKPADYPLENRSFTIVIIGKNNGASVYRTLQSVFQQNYENFRVIYIDDGSQDGSFALVQDLVSNSSYALQVELIRNEQSEGTLANLYRTIHNCPDEEIIVVLDGQDWLSHEWVLQRLNAYYANPDLWMTYGQYREYPTFQLGASRPIRFQEWKEKGFRSYPFVFSHLKTFYASLFKQIRGDDLIDQGQFLSASTDLAYMLPLLEMAQDHFQYIPEILYISNRQFAQKEDRELQIRYEKWIRSLPPYAPLASCKTG